MVRFFSIGGAALFFVSVAINLAQAQLSSALGDNHGYATAMEQLIGAAILIAVAGSTYPLANSIRPALDAAAAGGGDIDGLRLFWEGLARVVVGGLVGCGTMLMIIRVVGSMAKAQFGMVAGSSSEVSTAVLKIAGAIAAGLLTAMSVFIANLILSAVMGG